MTMTTPMMAQWHECKKEAKDALLLFRLGDFYEAFFEDAALMAKELGLTLTQRQDVPMCGVPHHTKEIYVDKLVAKGFKVAIAEQMEDPSQAKGIVRREIQEIITPGTLLSSNLLQKNKNNFFVSIVQIKKSFGLACIDLSTGEFRSMVFEEISSLADELCRLLPKECLVSPPFREEHSLFFKELSFAFPFLINEKEGIDLETAKGTLSLQFPQTKIEGPHASLLAAGSLLLYLKEELSANLDYVLHWEKGASHPTMGLDRSAIKNLELVESLFDSSSQHTLLSTLDFTFTPMGGRLLFSWITQPLLSLEEIEKRRETISLFLTKDLRAIGKLLEPIGDLERLLTKLSSGKGTPRDLLTIGVSLSYLSPLQNALINIFDLPLFDLVEMGQKIQDALVIQPPLRIGEGELFKEGYHPEIDALRSLAKESIHWMAQYQNELREETQIKTLKVGFTKAFGYYIEVSKGQTGKMPSHFQRRQTLVNAERYTSEILKKFEYQVLSAEERTKAMEALCFEQLKEELLAKAVAIRSTSKTIARIDALLSLAIAAQKGGWTRPHVDHSELIQIEEGRHPIIESVVGKNRFIPNDLFLSEKEQMMLITGPNMAGKSTYLRQTALIVILAQIGSYVPAKKAHIGLVDKIFCRLGASDDLARGRSTFMVEMSETAFILENVTSRSLVLLDEIGRGTSTYDGIAIAWAVAEYLLTEAHKRGKTLFATHYWELTQLAQEFPGAQNFQTAVQETPSGIVFLRKIIPGRADKSYGIHVARLAHLPAKAIHKAEEKLAMLEKNAPRKEPSFAEQLSLFPEPPPPVPLLEELKAIDPLQMTPLQALQTLILWKQDHAL